MPQLVFEKLGIEGNIYLSLIKRKKSIIGYVIKRFYIFFSDFNILKFGSDRYVSSRYHLLTLAKRLRIHQKMGYCFSHSGTYSAMVFSSSSASYSVDIEPVERRLTETLRRKIRILYTGLRLSELMVIMILESLVKLSIFKPPVSLSEVFHETQLPKIKSIKDNIFEVEVNNIKVFSKIYMFENLLICITLDSNQFGPFFSVSSDAGVKVAVFKRFLL